MMHSPLRTLPALRTSAFVFLNVAIPRNPPFKLSSRDRILLIGGICLRFVIRAGSS